MLAPAIYMLLNSSSLNFSESRLDALVETSLTCLASMVLSSFFAIRVLNDVSNTGSILFSLALLAWVCVFVRGKWGTSKPKNVPINGRERKLAKSQSKRSSKTLVVSFLLIVTYVLFLFGNKGDLRIRNGPDGFGWANSSLYFKENENLDSLNEKLKTALEPISPQQALDSGAYPPGESPIYAISDWSLQVQAEFIVASKRIALPALQGYIARYFDGINIWIVQSTLLLVLLFISVLVVAYHFARLFNKAVTIFFITFWALTIPISSTLLEGGVGVVWILPFVLFNVSKVIYGITRPSRSNVPSIIRSVILTWIILSTVYFDALPILLSLLPLYAYALRCCSKEDVSRNISTWKIFAYTVAPISTLTINWQDFMNAFANRVGDRNVGGWNIGTWPGILEWMNLWDWIAPSGVETRKFESILVYLGGLALLAIVLKVILEKRAKLEIVLVFSYLFMITVLAMVVFLIEEVSSYQPWRVLAFMSPLLIMSLPTLLSRDREGFYLAKIGSSLKISITLPLILSISTIMAVSFLLNVASNSKRIDPEIFDMAQEAKVQDILKSREIALIGNWSTGFGPLLIDESIHWQSRITRNYRFDNPEDRATSYILKKSDCDEINCLNLKSEEIEFDGDTFLIINQSGYKRLNAD